MTRGGAIWVASCIGLMAGGAALVVIGHAANHPSKPQCWIELKPDQTWEPLCKAGAYDIDTNYSKWPVVVVK
jgi:hypothetical protein